MTLSLGARIGNLARHARTFLENELFRIDPGLKRGLREHPLPETLRSAFAAHGHPLETTSAVVSASGWKWKIRSAGATYVVRNEGGHLSVSRERMPRLSQFIAKTLQVATKMFTAMRNRVFYVTAAVRKRYLDHPDKMMVNVGAGRWYVPGWKVVDYTGDWYRYGAGFVDYPLDLMKKGRFPFADESVDLFYSEHVFEHFPNDVAAFTFGELYRSLRSGGGVRIVVPDADILYAKFRARDERFFKPWMGSYNATLHEAFIVLVGFRDEPIDAGSVEHDFETLDEAAFFDRYTADLQYDYSRAGEHVNWFNFDKMRRMLHDAGFATVERSAPQSSRFPEIRGQRFDTRPHYSLHVDAVK
jgi:predicted SAM-dependent methyltransferase